jgi:predicted permease
MERLRQDLRFATRRLLRKPLFTAVAVVSLAIGIGANTAIFSLVNAVILRDLPVDRPEELVDIYRSVAGFSHATFSYPDYLDVKRDGEELFSEVALSRLAFVQTDTDDGVELLPGELVSGNFFPLLGVRAAVGRTLLPEDHTSPGGHPVVMLGHAYWQRRYGGDPGVVGEDIRLNGRSYTVVGVAPEAYTGSLRGIMPDIYASYMMVAQLNPSDYSEIESRGSQSLFLKGRLRPGVGLVQAQGWGDRLAANFREQYPGNWMADNEITLVATADVIMNPMVDRYIVPAAGLMMVVVGLVLLIACANLASFLLAQAADRKKEIAVRLALGAKRRRLIGQLLTESTLLAGVGGLAGVGVAALMLRALVKADLPLPFPIALDLSMDVPVLAFGLAVTLGAGLLFGLVPALQATNADVAPTLKDEGAGGGRPRRVTLRSALVVTQVAVSLVLLVGAGLFLRSLQARVAVDPGFGYEPAAVVSLQTPPDLYEEEETRVFMRSLQEQVLELPGIGAVGLTSDLHLSSMNNQNMGIVADGVEPPPGQDFHLIEWAGVTPGFFDAAGIPIIQGRNFDQADVPDAEQVAIVSAAMAARFWPGQDPVGRTLRRGEADYTVVGVAGDAKVRSLGESPRPFIYRPYDQAFSSAMTLVATTRGDAQKAMLDVLALARRLEPELMVFETKTMERHLGVMLLPHRLSALIVSSFGVLALLLASIGLYGVVSYAVSTRSREVGIRMALGADPGSVVSMLTRGGLKLVLVGAVVGLALAFVSARLLGSLLYGVDANDPVAFGAVPALLGGVAFLAAWIPARRASVVNPVRALKAD